MNVNYNNFKKYFKNKKVVFILFVPSVNPANLEVDDFKHLPETNELRLCLHNKLGEIRIENITANDFEVVNIIELS